MGAGFLLAFVARHSSLLPSARQHSKLSATPDVALIDYERPSNTVSHAQPTAEPRPAGDQGALLLLLSSFHLNLEERLKLLQLQSTGGTTHPNWLLDAFASTLSTHSSLQSTFTATAGSLGSCISVSKHRADEVLPLLDVCTALKQVVDDLERQCGYLQSSVESVGQALSSKQSLASSRLRAAANRLSASLLQKWPHANVLCAEGKHMNMPQTLAEARYSLLLTTKSRESQSATATTSIPPHPEAALFSQALDGTMLISLLALAATVSSLEPPSPRKCYATINRRSKLVVRYLGAKGLSTPWIAPLRRLHQDLKQEAMSSAGGSLFQELQRLHTAATKLHAMITFRGALSIELAVMKQSVESLGKSLRELQLCIGMLRMQLASFFQALIALRLALLEQ